MLEIVGIIAGIVAATSILLFGSRGLVDLVRGIADRKKRVNDHSSTVQESVEAVTSPPTIPDATERPPSLLTEIPAVSTGAVFVGRQRELATLKSALEDAVAGRGRVVMLAGEPGIGKTRIVEELASYATATGSQVLWGRCYEDSDDLPCARNRPRRLHRSRPVIVPVGPFYRHGRWRLRCCSKHHQEGTGNRSKTRRRS
ncbi:MAG: ATP-binding protein, partial [Chloroflexi bacterium]|nr:ATP-binding protein [Chloroflexota bacterium]